MSITMKTRLIKKTKAIDAYHDWLVDQSIEAGQRGDKEAAAAYHRALVELEVRTLQLPAGWQPEL